MRVTGKRHPYLSRYRVGFDADGRIEALSLELYSDGGCAADLSLAVMERSMLHADNAYFIPNIAVSGTVCRTNLPSNTAMRGFGGPQGIAADRKRDRGDRGLPGPRCPRGAPAELLRRPGTRHHALRPGGGQQHAAGPARPARRDGRLRPPPRRDRAVQRGLAHPAPRARADAGQVRDLVHAADAQPGQCAGQHLPRRHDPGLDRRDRDGAGAQHQDSPDRRRRSSRCRSSRSGSCRRRPRRTTTPRRRPRRRAPT